MRSAGSLLRTPPNSAPTARLSLGNLLAGTMSRTARRLVKEWAIAHTEELEADWERARLGEPLERIEPLE
ncbi:MAG: DUF4160 domain-containing protein [Actinomycetota bacterium]